MSKADYNRRDFLKLTGMGTAAISMNGLFSLCAPKSDRPNIVLIMADDMGYSDIGCYGGEIDTPNLNQLADNGIRFTQFYNTSRCCPTRASLLTGLYAHQAGMGWMTNSDLGSKGYSGEINKNCVTIAEVLKEAGYSNYLSGKWHVTATEHWTQAGPKDSWPLQRGFDKFFGNLNGGGSYFTPQTLARDNMIISPGEDYYHTDAISDNACSFIDEHFQQKQNPFFLYVAYTAPHWPLHAKEKDIKKYEGRYMDGWDELRKSRFEKMRQMGIINKKWNLSPKGEKIPDWDSLSGEQKNDMDRRMAVYAAQIDCMDQGIGRIIQSLKKAGEFDNTVVLFLSDNGGTSEFQSRGESKRTEDIGKSESWESYRDAWANASNTPYRIYKRWEHEGGISTPFIVHWPRGIKTKGELRQQVGHVIDLMPTCVALAKAKYPSRYNGKNIIPVEGQSLVPAFDNEPLSQRDLFWEHNANRAVRSGDWKLVSFGTKKAPYVSEWELYNLKEDRTETQNLAYRYPDKVGELAEKWHKWAQRANVYPLDGRGWGAKLKSSVRKKVQN